MILGRFPTVPEYFSEHINHEVDLVLQPKQCCPFHDEKTPSFSYNIVTGRWSCFGKCHAHGDVIEMHKRFYHFNTKEEAEIDLRKKYNVPKKTVEQVMFDNKEVFISEENIENNTSYVTALSLANTSERWLELDYEMSKTPFDSVAIDILIKKWTGKKSVLED